MDTFEKQRKNLLNNFCLFLLLLSQLFEHQNFINETFSLLLIWIFIIFANFQLTLANPFYRATLLEIDNHNQIESFAEMSQPKIQLNDLKQSLPSFMHDSIPENLSQLTSFIKMKRLPQIDDSLLILTEYMSLNLSFTSPLLEAIDFLEQYHKYQLRSILSSFPIPNEAFDSFYNEIQNTIMFKYKRNVTRIMKIVYEMVNVANCEKINEMKMYQDIFSQIKNELLLNRKQTDPYGFNPAQFQADKQDVKRMIEFCEKYLNINNITELQTEDKQKMRKQNENFRLKAKQQIQKLTQKIKTKAISMMDKMNDAKVQHPYRPQNQAYEIVDIQKLMDSFYKKLKIKNLQIDEDLQSRRYGIEKQVRKMLEQGLKQYKQETSLYAKSIIEDYNSQCKSSKNSNHDFKTSLSPPILNLQSKRSMDANDIHMSFSDSSEMRPAIKNVRKQLKFDKIVKLNDLDNKTEDIIEIDESHLPVSSLKKDSTNEVLDLDFDFDANINPLLLRKSKSKNLIPNQHQRNQQKPSKIEVHKKKKLTFDQNMKKLQAEFAQYNKTKEQSNKLSLSKLPKLKFNKNIFVQKNFIISSLFEHEQEPQSKSKKLVQRQSADKLNTTNPFQKKKASSFQNQKQQVPHTNQNEPEHEYIFFKNASEKSRFYDDFSKLSQQEIQRLETQNQNFETQKKVEYQRKVQGLIPVFVTKTYEKFCSLTYNPKTKKGTLDTKNSIQGDKIYRYGLEISAKWQSYTSNKKPSGQSQKMSQYRTFVPLKLVSSDIQKLNKFFFYTFKQRYYRLTKNVQENSQIPILMAVENESEFLNEKMVKKIITLMKKFEFFVLWTYGDIIAYEQKVEFGLRKATITVYTFASNEKLGAGLIWQIRKRVDETFKQENLQNQKINDRGRVNKASKYVLEEKIDFLFHEKSSFSQNKQTINQILCKVECVHRVFYDRHKRPLTVQRAVEKGKELWDQLVKWKLTENFR